MDRVFQIGEVESLCKEMKDVFEQCIQQAEDMGKYADEAESALGSVPGDVKDSGASSAVTAL